MAPKSYKFVQYLKLGPLLYCTVPGVPTVPFSLDECAMLYCMYCELPARDFSPAYQRSRGIKGVFILDV